MQKSVLCGMTPDELIRNLDQNGIDSSYALKLTYWVYKKRIREISEINNISKEIRKLVFENFEPGLFGPVRIQISKVKHLTEGILKLCICLSPGGKHCAYQHSQDAVWVVPSV
jgi:adenine C2-methylase RlmN of 23S rRNA A2503 and tRNA A37